MFWKERYFGQGHTYARLLRWAGMLLVIVFLGSHLILGAIVAWDTWLEPKSGVEPKSGWVTLASDLLGYWTAAAKYLKWLIQLAMGFRAAGAIASERERATWETVLITPLDGREIVGGKIFGSLYALRWFVIAVILGWTVSALSGAMPPEMYLQLLAETLVVGVFMVVAGVWSSLSCRTTTKAMTWTILCWLGAIVATAILAGMLIGIISLVLVLISLYLSQSVPFLSGPAALMWIGVAYVIIRLSLYALAAILVALHCRRHFDRLAGRSYSPWYRSEVDVRRRPAPASQRANPPKCAEAPAPSQSL
jgi:ABC-type transport system involved in multi-copper enzyme maturation permease subunit